MADAEYNAWFLQQNVIPGLRKSLAIAAFSEDPMPALKSLESFITLTNGAMEDVMVDAYVYLVAAHAYRRSEGAMGIVDDATIKAVKKALDYVWNNHLYGRYHGTKYSFKLKKAMAVGEQLGWALADARYPAGAQAVRMLRGELGPLRLEDYNAAMSIERNRTPVRPQPEIDMDALRRDPHPEKHPERYVRDEDLAAVAPRYGPGN